MTREGTLDLEDRGEVVDWLGQRSRVLVVETTLWRTDFQMGPSPPVEMLVGVDVHVSLQIELLRESDATQLDDHRWGANDAAPSQVVVAARARPPGGTAVGGMQAPCNSPYPLHGPLVARAARTSA